MLQMKMFPAVEANPCVAGTKSYVFLLIDPTEVRQNGPFLQVLITTDEARILALGIDDAVQASDEKADSQAKAAKTRRNRK